MVEPKHIEAGKQLTSEPVKGARPLAATKLTAPALQAGRIDARSLTPQAILALQRTAGNRAVNTLLHRDSPLPLQRDTSRNPGITVTPIDPDPAVPANPQHPRNPGITVTPIDPDPSTTEHPRVASVSKQRFSVDGKQIEGTERMRVGERLRVWVTLEHSTPGATRGMGSAFITNSLRKESLDVDATGMIMVVFQATQVGDEHAEMRFIPAGTAASDQLYVSVETHIEMGQDAFDRSIVLAKLEADNAYHAAKYHMTQVGKPYRAAWDQVEKTLKKASAPNPVNAFFEAAAIAFLAGVGAGEVAAVLETFKQGNPLIDGLKDLTNYFAKAGLNSLIPGASSVTLPQSPADWVDASNAPIEKELLLVGTLLADALRASNENRAEVFRDFDAVAVVNAALKVDGRPMLDFADMPVPPADEFEKTIWKALLKTYGYSGNGPAVDDAHADEWMIITGRIDELGEDSQKYLNTYLGAGADQWRKEHADT